MQVMNPGRPFFVPIVYRLAARIEQIALADMVLDPTYYANLLEGAYKLLKQDAIITNFDPSLEAELFGCQVEWQNDYELPVVMGWSNCELESVRLESSSRIPVVLEAIKRLVLTRGREVAIIGVVTGPCSLARNVAESAKLDKDYKIEDIISLTGNQLIKLTKSICELKVDAIIFREDLLAEKYSGELLSFEKAYTVVYATLFNLTRFYNTSALIMVRENKPESIGELVKKLRPNGIILNGLSVKRDDLIYLKNLSELHKLAVGLSLSVKDEGEMLNQFKVLDDFAQEAKPRGFFYTSDGEIPQNISLELIRDLARKIKGVQES
jgi:uroporphyrinogen decarboxylase